MSTPTTRAQQYDFKAGQLYYKITDAANHKVAVVSEKTTLAIEAVPDNGYKLDSTCLNGKRLGKLVFMVEEASRIEAFFGK